MLSDFEKGAQVEVFMDALSFLGSGQAEARFLYPHRKVGTVVESRRDGWGWGFEVYMGPATALVSSEQIHPASFALS